MKKIFLVVVLLVYFSFAAKPTMEVGAFETLIGWKQYTPGGQLESIVGVNWLMGFTYKRYFDRLQVKAVNPYWMVGTAFITTHTSYVMIGYGFTTYVYGDNYRLSMSRAVPMAGIGLDYVVDENWTLGGALSFPLTNLHVSYSF